jgi:O-antigen ligase
LLEAGRWSILLCLVSVPINKPATNIFIFFGLLFALLGERTTERFREACKHPVVIGAIAWFLLLLINVIAIAPAGPERWEALRVYKVLFYPLIVAMLLETPRWRTRGLMAFGISTTLVLLISWLLFFWGPQHVGKIVSSGSYTVFKNYTQQGLALLVLAALAMAFANVETSRKRKSYLWLIAGAAFGNVIFLLTSRTAYLIAVPLLLYWAWQLNRKQGSGWRRAVTIVLALALLGAAASFTPRVQQRLAQLSTDLSRYSDQHDATSLGVRLELWKRTMPIIAAAPVLGNGLGQWSPIYRTQIGDNKDLRLFIQGHPHQEALLILSEQGVVGFGILVLMLALLTRYVKRLAPPERDFYTCLILIYVTAGLANCVLADFAHRHLFIMLLACIPLIPAAENRGPHRANP